MISEERYDELNAIAIEIFEALATERYEPSERGAGWAPTDAGCESVIKILGRAKARAYQDSPAEKRKHAIAQAKRKTDRDAAQAKRVAERLMGPKNTGVCIHCARWLSKENEKTLWRTSDGSAVCQPIKPSTRTWQHEVAK